MRNLIISISIFSYLLTFAACTSKQSPILEHPYMLIRPSDREMIKERVKTGLAKEYFDQLGDGNHKGGPPVGIELAIALEKAVKYCIDPLEYQSYGVEAANKLVHYASDSVGTKKVNALLNQTADGRPRNREFTIAHILRATSLIYDMCYDLLSPDQRITIRDWLYDTAVFLSEAKKTDIAIARPHQNHQAATITGPGIAAFAIMFDGHPDQSKIDSLINRANRYVPQWMMTGEGVKADGQQWEGTAYVNYSLPMICSWAEIYNNIYNENIFEGKNILNVIQWFGYSIMSDGHFPQDGDDYGRFQVSADYLITLKYNPSPENKWLWNQIHPGGDCNKNAWHFNELYKTSYVLWYPDDLPMRKPTNESIFMRDNPIGINDTTGGVVHLKNGWDYGNNINLMLCSRYHRYNKGSYDQGAIKLYAFGERFTDDSERWDYIDWDNSWRELCSVDRFSTVTFDDSENFPMHFQERVTSELGTVHGFVTSEYGDYTRANGRYPYADVSKHMKGLGSKKYDYYCSDKPDDEYYVTPINRADRTLMFIKEDNPYFIIIDDLFLDDKTHEFSWRFHSNGFPISGEGITDNPFKIIGSNSTLEITFTSPEKIEYENTKYEYPGVSHPLLMVNQKEVNPVYFAILYPRRPGFSRPDITPVSIENGYACQIDWGNKTDHIFYSNEQSLKSVDLSTDSRMTFIREKSDSIVSYLVGEGTNVVFKGKSLVNTSGSMVSVVYGDKEIKITGDITNGKFYGPNAKHLTINNAENSFVRDDEYVIVGK